MARISTYQIDTVIHPDDNVIGTDPSNNNATRLFPVSSLATHINLDRAAVWPSSITSGAGATDAAAEREAAVLAFDFARDTDAEYDDDTLTGTLTYPRKIFTHNMNSRNVLVKVYEEQTVNIGVTRAEFILGNTVTAHVEISPAQIVIIDLNRVLVDLGEIRDFTGYVVISG